LQHKRRARRRAKKDHGYLCAWCLTEISSSDEHFGFGAKAPPDVDLSDVEGKWIDIQLVSAGKTVQVGVTTPDSPARREQGYLFRSLQRRLLQRVAGRSQRGHRGRVLGGISELPQAT
jgi:hypothetical protein